MLPVQRFAVDPGLIQCMGQAAGSGVVIDQCKFPQINISADGARLLPGDVGHNPSHLLAVCQQSLREHPHTEVCLGQVNPNRTVGAACVHLGHQRAA